MPTPENTPSYRPVALWLFACCAAVFAMIVVGAITRLSGSGLSITEWRPILGAIPPLDEESWNAAFGLYKQGPQFQKENFWMDLADFKKIYFWEWFHRLLGRLIGILYALPLAFFWIRGKIPRDKRFILLSIFVLGGLQGAMGWYMVQSGLVDIPAVSHYRLAAHLGLALLIYVLMFWQGLDFWPARKNPSAPLFRHGIAVLFFVAAAMLWGAFTAGLDAGLIYNDSFPLMGGKLIPSEMWQLDPIWINIFENRPAVQFTHRWLAILSVLMIFGFWLHASLEKKNTPAIHALAIMALAQAGLGIFTLLSGINLHLAATHQAGAVITLSLLLITLRSLKPRDN
jgi:cytochrome c oxidase assembly protein subunit 15